MKLPFEIPGYRIVRRLGLGGMATVYLAIQASLSRPVAIKVLSSERMPSDEVVRRFEHEARTIARLDHPHIVSIHDVGRTSNGQIYYTMPYLPNGDLSQRNLRDNPQQVLDIIRALADGLGYAHDQGIVHRDVKPENVLFDKMDRPLLADFGIALSGSHQPRVTREGATIGSSGYMSPEQARGRPIDGRSDFYSLGVVCYELLTGEMPFNGPDTLAVALAHIEKPVPRLPVTRRAWQPFIDKALAKQPEARFQSAEELLAELDVVERRINTPPKGFARWWLAIAEQFVAVPRRTRALVVCLLIVLAFAALVALVPQVPKRAADPQQAETTPSPATQPAPDPANAPPPNAPDTVASTGSESDPPVDEAPPSADSELSADETRAALLKKAAEQIRRGRLAGAAEDSAGSLYLRLLQDDPRQREALKGIARVLALLGKRAATAIASSDPAAAEPPMQEALTLAERAGVARGSAFDAFVKAIQGAVNERRAQRHDAFDTSSIQPLAPLLATFSRLDPELARTLQNDLDRPAELLAAGGTFRDPQGPGMVVVPTVLAATAHIERAFAISAGDVTRGAYERFVEATGRKPARCRESRGLFARSEGLSWRNPGFTQGDDHPVVCVSWNDAEAYVHWLSQRAGVRYRLPSAAEWRLVAQPAGAGTTCGSANIGRRSGRSSSCDDGYAQTAPVGRFPPTPPGLYDIAGNVAEWVDGCAKPGKGAACDERVFRGVSWRDDDAASNLTRTGGADGETGYADVGFRVVRELPDLPAPN